MESNDKLEQLLRQMYAKQEDIDTSDIIDEEWAKFEAKHFGSEEVKSEEVESKRFSFLKIAAMFMGVLMLSGIVYAAVKWWEASPSPSQREDVQIHNSAIQGNQALSSSEELGDTLRVFENASLDSILMEVATFYQCENVFKNEEVKHVRLFFTWDKTKSIDDVVRTFNNFERIHITRENQQLIVE